jgi:hypothetical protein
VISSSQGLYLNTGKHKHRINTYMYETSMPCMEFKPTIPVNLFSEDENTRMIVIVKSVKGIDDG